MKRLEDGKEDPIEISRASRRFHPDGDSPADSRRANAVEEAKLNGSMPLSSVMRP